MRSGIDKYNFYFIYEKKFEQKYNLIIQSSKKTLIWMLKITIEWLLLIFYNLKKFQSVVKILFIQRLNQNSQYKTSWNQI